MDRKPEWVVQAKVMELKRMTMSRRITLRTISAPDKLRASDKSNHHRMKQRMNKIFRVTKAIVEWEPHGIFTHSHLSLYKFFSIFYDNILLLGCLSPLYKILTQS